MNNQQLFKALADESRIRILTLLKNQAYCVEDLAESLNLAVSTVSAHLKKLQAAGLVYCQKVQYYSVYHLKQEVLQQSLNELIPSSNPSAKDPYAIMREKVLKHYFKDGKCFQLPVQNKKRWIVYEEVIKLIEPGRDYQERELNALITQIHEDYCLIRRELVEEGVLERSDGIYRLVDRYWENPGFYQRIWRKSELDENAEK
ncbi:MAG: metalloregulator ArsR/SmtB family transcription factor [Candidatus Cloacimonetes bacterium]|jgi:biotin operon repressor|nr:metalloregulator ArsR/SmtB family transcription factor [Candidatus Cloacimonadota bacterium]MDY0337317.1 metalloregulator ArsR/SmtB family transcription factor [Candidatus Cloacimonadaceae bacterium]MCK9333997.1 metalloregulator ArsR/SmtB family transcription factor [Candidatus Cloacimonadota bacterium]MDD2543781.1 metalloregulator ArsR/SmtB family transcription factor [Candidatus Cloacimonadota bacterium]MDD2682695.1 metalloregulator ArsR/SmtB family transcription factor [Candidatus Cloacim